MKDLFATRGTRTTWGAKPYEHQMIDHDATAVERLLRAGAVLVAKLSTGELAIGDVWFGGRTRNPWNPDRGASGSSAGPASAVAAGLVQLTNLTGHPAVSLPAGFVDELPVGVMVTGRTFDEATILGMALAFERATTWHTMHPRTFHD